MGLGYSQRDAAEAPSGPFWHIPGGERPAREGTADRKLTKPRRTNSRRLWESRWHVGEANFYPRDRRLFERDFGRVVREYVVPGFAPPEPLLDRTDTVVTLGSCFATELRGFLKEAGVASSNFLVPETLNNTYSLLDFFSWCATGAETGRGFRYGRLDSGEICEWTPEAERDSYTAAFAEAGAFVFTLGIAEVWEDRATGGVVWRGIPEEIFGLIRRLNRDAPIVLTLSPVPMRATCQDMSCMAADCISKSILRTALAQVMPKHLPGVYYRPGSRSSGGPDRLSADRHTASTTASHGT